MESEASLPRSNPNNEIYSPAVSSLNALPAVTDNTRTYGHSPVPTLQYPDKCLSNNIAIINHSTTTLYSWGKAYMHSKIVNCETCQWKAYSLRLTGLEIVKIHFNGP